MTATERFKKLYADAIERVCVLEEKLEQAYQRIGDLESEPSTQPDPETRRP